LYLVMISELHDKIKEKAEAHDSVSPVNETTSLPTPLGRTISRSHAVYNPIKTPTTPSSGVPLTGGLFFSLPAKSSLIDDVPEPPLEEMSIMLELLTQDLNLTEDKKQVLRDLPSDRKWVMLQQHLGERYRDGAAKDVNKVSEEIERLRSGPDDKELLTSMAVSLRSRPIRWISNFIDNGGLDSLIANLKILEDANRYRLTF
jgi:hypothetical protein